MLWDRHIRKAKEECHCVCSRESPRISSFKWAEDGLVRPKLPFYDNGNTAIFKSSVALKSGIVCSAIEDATPENVPPSCRNASIRMASTRTTSRAIGLACHVGTLEFEPETMNNQVIAVDYRDSSASSAV